MKANNHGERNSGRKAFPGRWEDSGIFYSTEEILILFFPFAGFF